MHLVMQKVPMLGLRKEHNPRLAPMASPGETAGRAAGRPWVRQGWTKVLSQLHFFLPSSRPDTCGPAEVAPPWEHPRGTPGLMLATSSLQTGSMLHTGDLRLRKATEAPQVLEEECDQGRMESRAAERGQSGVGYTGPPRPLVRDLSLGSAAEGTVGGQKEEGPALHPNQQDP